MDDEADSGPLTRRIDATASRLFLRIETFAYIILGLLLALAALVAMGGAGLALLDSIHAAGEADAVVTTIDRLLFVLMIVEILHTVRVSFRAGTLVSEPFLVVGLIASIRRVLAITLESSQISGPAKWSADSQAMFTSTMTELCVLGGLILVMVVSICLLRHSARPR